MAVLVLLEALGRGWGCSRGGDSGLQFVPRGAEGQCGVFALSFGSKSGSEPGISVPQEPCSASARGMLPRFPGLGSRIRANPVLRQKVMGGKEAITKQTPQPSPTAHCSGTINRRKGTKIAPRVAVWTQQGSRAVLRGGGCSPAHPDALSHGQGDVLQRCGCQTISWGRNDEWASGKVPEPL